MDPKVLLLVFALNWGGLFLVVYLVILKTVNLFIFYIHKVHIATPDEVLHETVKTWWRTENFGCRYDCDVQRSVEDEKVLKFLSERTQEVEGHYEVSLPWKDENIQLPDNRVVAIHRLGLLEKRLQRDPELGEAYKKPLTQT